MTKPVRVILAGGGTAGHTSPLIATAEQLRALADVDILCIGTPRGLESRVIPEAGLELAMIPPVPFPRRPNADLVALPGRLHQAVARSKELLRHQQAQVVAGFGGYVSLPVYLAARSEKIPLIIHEGNAVPGLANKVGARFADDVLTAFPDTPLPRALAIGLPVRSAIAELDPAARRPAARTELGLPPSGLVLLVSGGSQGARSLNRATEEAADQLLAAGISILHVLGAANMTDETVARTHSRTGATYRPLAYVDDMATAYAAADLMLGRSGAGTVMETAMIGLPTVFVPLPHGNGEQARNADFLLMAGAARVIHDADLTATALVDTVTGLLGDPDRLRLMSATCRELATSGAAYTMAQIMLRRAAGKD